ncbi:MAG: LptF/LptG family permease [Bacteroidaceae bacterium]|nr:LptF/LptG family permease [Bacteroidaceae bacterium]
MRIIKKLDIFILKGYLQLFAGTFFICLFIFLMQFVWKYVDDLVGKGLTWDILAKFFWYCSLTLIPLSVPLAVLLASLITFGNFGERFELLAMKASGIPLIRILMPVFITALLICSGSFYFQNNVSPEANKQLYSLLWSMRQKSPELDIPEGIFYSDIPGYNLYVERKDAETGMLYGVMIYTNTDNYEDTQIVIADSGRLQSTADKTHLKLTLYDGERFKNMSNQSGAMLRANIPYMRESFIEEIDYIAFDNQFNLFDASLFAGNAQAKNLSEIYRGIDSIRSRTDSIGHSIYENAKRSYLSRELSAGRKDSAKIVKEVADIAPFDTLFNQLRDDQKSSAWKSALNRTETMKAECEFRSTCYTTELNTQLRRHLMEAQKKYTLSLSCLLFFFIGAPLGAIIRKGGLGIPVVVSVVFFIFYYIINVAGENNAKVGAWDAYFGEWLSSMVLLPIGGWLTYKANSDSVVFDIEGYKKFFMKLLGLRISRKLNRKEVILYDPDYTKCREEMQQLIEDCKTYSDNHFLLMMPSYWHIFFQYQEDTTVIGISKRLEALIKELHNSKSNVIIGLLNMLPFIIPDAHTRPFRNARRNKWAGVILPVGILLWLRIWRYRLRLSRDLDKVQEIGQEIIKRINAIENETVKKS